MNTAKIYEVEFIIAGPVGYPEEGENAVYYIRDETLAKMASSMIGKPVLFSHEGTTPIGHVSDVFRADNGYWTAVLSVCEAEANEKLANGWNFSCCYKVTSLSENIQINLVNYKYEILDGIYEHIAVVEHPRFNEIKFLKKNSKEGENMKLNFFSSNSITKKNNSDTEKDKEKENNAVEEESKEYFVEVNGKQIPLSELIEVYKARKENKASLLSPDELIEIEGEKLSVAELVEIYQSAKTNQASEEKDKTNQKINEVLEKDKKKELVNEKPITNEKVFANSNVKPISFMALKKTLNSVPEEPKKKEFRSLSEQEQLGNERY